MPLLSQTEIWLPLAIILSSLISEDAATSAAALLAAHGKLGPVSAFASAFLGIWIGDLALFAASRSLRATWLSRVSDHHLLRTVQHWFDRHGSWALVLTRFIPGTRFLTYITAGATRMPTRVFAAVTAVCAFFWVGLIFLFAYQSATLATVLAIPAKFQVVFVFGSILGAYLLLRQNRTALLGRLEILTRWEFWPAWLFYPPVAVMCFWLGIKHGGLALPSVANPAQKNGGIVGESKIEILDALRAEAHESVAPAYLMPPAPPAERSQFLRHIAEQNGLSLPLVLKPDVAQRGAGFCKLTRWEDADAYFRSVPQAVVAQEYVAGPYEAGIFYYRLPGDVHGGIFSITHKEFPVVVGDGRSSLEELIRGDARAALIAPIYLRRFQSDCKRVVPEGEVIRLVEAGNHCQGCVFRNGAQLRTAALENAFDRIARRLPGFYIGRFDIRYTSSAELMRGTGFKIIELNGAASEATDIYDPESSLLNAYHTLYRQWDLVYRIGRMNRDRGASTSSIWEIAAEWARYRQNSAMYPAAD